MPIWLGCFARLSAVCSFKAIERMDVDASRSASHTYQHEHASTSSMTKTCPRCKVEMGRGIGINPTTPDWLKRALGGPEVPINNDTLRLDEVLKCPRCGHSEDLR